MHDSTPDLTPWTPTRAIQAAMESYLADPTSGGMDNHTVHYLVDHQHYDEETGEHVYPFEAYTILPRRGEVVIKHPACENGGYFSLPIIMVKERGLDPTLCLCGKAHEQSQRRMLANASRSKGKALAGLEGREANRPWIALGISRRTYYRKLASGAIVEDGTGTDTPLSLGDNETS